QGAACSVQRGERGEASCLIPHAARCTLHGLYIATTHPPYRGRQAGRFADDRGLGVGLPAVHFDGPACLAAEQKQVAKTWGGDDPCERPCSVQRAACRVGMFRQTTRRLARLPNAARWTLHAARPLPGIEQGVEGGGSADAAAEADDGRGDPLAVAR